MDTCRTSTVGRKKKLNPNSERIDLRATPEWVARLEEAAFRKGLSISAYIREAVADRMDGENVPQTPKPRRPKPD